MSLLSLAVGASALAADPPVPPVGVPVESGPPASAPATFLPRTSRIAYKQDDAGAVGSLMARIGGGLLLITVLAFGVTLLAKRYLPGIRGFSADGKSHVQLLESRRITARLTLFVIEFEGRRLLLAQSGDRVVEVGARPAARGENTVVDQ